MTRKFKLTLKQLRKDLKYCTRSLKFGEDTPPVTPVTPVIKKATLFERAQAKAKKINWEDVAKVAALTAGTAATGYVAYKGGKAIAKSDSGKIIGNAAKDRANFEKNKATQKVTAATDAANKQIEQVKQASTQRAEQARQNLNTAIDLRTKDIGNKAGAVAGSIQQAKGDVLASAQNIRGNAVSLANSNVISTGLANKLANQIATPLNATQLAHVDQIHGAAMNAGFTPKAQLAARNAAVTAIRGGKTQQEAHAIATVAANAAHYS